MGKWLTFVLILIMAGAAVYGQKPEVIKFGQLKTLIDTKLERVKVINFWATWCGPCVKELPLFEKLNLENKSVAVSLVSIDLDLDPNTDKVISFVNRKKILSRVYMLEEKEPNKWIPFVDTTWTGALPATLLINDRTGKRKFIEGELHEGDLEKLLAELN